YSTISIGSAFQTLDRNYRSASFDRLLDKRQEVSEFLGTANPNSSLDSSGFYDGYGPSQQNVVVGAFLNTYSGNSTNSRSINPVKNVPLLNWSIYYNGLTKFKFFKKFTQNFTVRHGYASNVTVGGMQTNLDAEMDSDGFLTARDLKDNFIPEQRI